MLALQQEVYIPKNHQLTIKIPDNIPTGTRKLFLIFEEPLQSSALHKERVFGGAIGALKMSNDFDQPLPENIIEEFYK
jgi:hypothetical protein